MDGGLQPEARAVYFITLCYSAVYYLFCTLFSYAYKNVRAYKIAGELVPGFSGELLPGFGAGFVLATWSL